MNHFRHILPALGTWLALLSAGAAAESRVTLTLTVTNAPTNGASLTFNGTDARYWVTSITNAASNIHVTNTAAAAKSNLYGHCVSYRVAAGYSTVNISSNSFAIWGPLGSNWSAAASGGWATLAWTTQSYGSSYPLTLPYTAVTNLATRTNAASLLAEWLSQPSTNLVSDTAAMFAGYATLDTEQVVTGFKTFTNQALFAYEPGFTDGFFYGTNTLTSGAWDIGADSKIIWNAGAIVQGSASDEPYGNFNLGAPDNYTFARKIDLAAWVATNIFNPDTFHASTNTVNVKSGALVTNLALRGATAVQGYATLGGTNYLSFDSGAWVQDGTGSKVWNFLATPNTNTVLRAVETSNAIAQAIATNWIPQARASNTWFAGTNTVHSMVYATRGTVNLAAGANSGVVLGTNVFIRMQCPSSGAWLAGCAAEADGSYHLLQFIGGTTNLILDSSGLEAVAANRIQTGREDSIGGTNLPFWHVGLVYDALRTNWVVMSVW